MLAGGTIAGGLIFKHDACVRPRARLRLRASDPERVPGLLTRPGGVSPETHYRHVRSVILVGEVMRYFDAPLRPARRVDQA